MKNTCFGTTPLELFDPPKGAGENNNNLKQNLFGQYSSWAEVIIW